MKTRVPEAKITGKSQSVSAPLLPILHKVFVRNARYMHRGPNWRAERKKKEGYREEKGKRYGKKNKAPPVLSLSSATI
jgi:hypothetical protein